jgi:trigger factor
MQVTRNELNPCTIELTVVCDESAVRAGFDRAYKDLAKHVRVPGFRPGHAPRNVVQQMISKEHAYDQAANTIMNSAFKTALQQEKLEPHGESSVELKVLDEDSARCEFVVKVPLKPQVELAEYKGLLAKKPIVEVEEAEVDRQVDELRGQKSTREAITDRGVQEGDVAVVNIKVDGEEGEGRNFMTMAGQTFEDLDKALLGMKVEELKSLELNFPKNFQEKDWAGQTMKCRVTLRSLSAVKLPELDASFAKAYKAENVDELRGRIRGAIEQAKSAMSDDYVSEQLIENLLEQSTIHVPDPMWEGVAGRRLSELAEDQRKKGKTIEQYAAEQGMTVQELVEAWRHEAQLFVKRAVLIQEIFEREKLQLTPPDLNAELGAMAREFGIEPESLLSQLK